MSETFEKLLRRQDNSMTEDQRDLLINSVCMMEARAKGGTVSERHRDEVTMLASAFYWMTANRDALLKHVAAIEKERDDANKIAAASKFQNERLVAELAAAREALRECLNVVMLCDDQCPGDTCDHNGLVDRIKAALDNSRGAE